MKKHQMNCVTSEKMSIVADIAASLAGMVPAAGGSLREAGATGTAGATASPGLATRSRASRAHEVAASSATRTAFAGVPRLGVATSGSHCRQNAPDTSSNASRRSSRASTRPHISVRHAAKRPAAQPQTSEAGTKPGARPASSAGTADASPPAAPTTPTAPLRSSAPAMARETRGTWASAA